MTTTRKRKRRATTSAEDDRIAKFLHEAMLPEHAAEARHFVRFCRDSLFIRAWLFERFAVKPATQAAFRKLLADPASIASDAALWSPLVTRLVLSEPPHQAGGKGPHGGLSEARILALVKRYQGGGMDAMTFLLVRLWTRLAASGRTDVPAGFLDAITAHWTALASDPSGRLVHDFLRAVRFFGERSDQVIGEADFGHANSWKIHVLLYILDYPKPRYQVGELHANLPVKYRHVDRRAIRQFCKEHGIRRDQRPGERPALADDSGSLKARRDD
jgi:hypothetical protein